MADQANITLPLRSKEEIMSSLSYPAPSTATDQADITLPLCLNEGITSITHTNPYPQDISRIRQTQEKVLRAIAETRAETRARAKVKVGSRGPVSVGKGLIRSKGQNKGKEKKKPRNRGWRRKNSYTPREHVPYREFFNNLRPRAGFRYDEVDKVPRESGEAIRDRIGELSGTSIDITALDARLKEAFVAATDVAKEEVLCARELVRAVVQRVPWLQGLKARTVGHCLDYFYQARVKFSETYPLNSYVPGGPTDPDSAKSIDRLILATTAWSLVPGLDGLINLPVRPFELTGDDVLADEWDSDGGGLDADDGASDSAEEAAAADTVTEAEAEDAAAAYRRAIESAEDRIESFGYTDPQLAAYQTWRYYSRHPEEVPEDYVPGEPMAVTDPDLEGFPRLL